MRPEILSALLDTIEEWKKRVQGDPGEGIYALCIVANHDCKLCLIYEKTGFGGCSGTPYWDWIESGHSIEAAQEEVKFLESLLPVNKDPAFQFYPEDWKGGKHET